MRDVASGAAIANEVGSDVADDRPELEAMT